MLASLVVLATEGASEVVDGEQTVPLPPYVYGIIALAVLLLLLLLVTRLDLDR
jgi:hypothetical protein